ncbi:hypothetical protein Dsin_002422 [Dipteronia sinensis]|uniref:PHD-type domain-containing protein n=1 Tax=Dipteronia sinensis TaxID=43782 RepID=A0AAE0EJE0_9ROSI|nr:hypothetical protein Dsin_002422 [Dipteronia sinensis]
MAAEEGTSNGDGTEGLKRSEVNNGSAVRVEHEFGDRSSDASEGLQTYKRRKCARASSESKGLEDRRASVEPDSRLADQRHCRSVVLEHLYQSLSDDEGGIQSCIREAIVFPPEINYTMKVKGSDTHDRNGHKSSQTGIPNGTQYSAKGHAVVISNEPRNESSHHIVTDKCQRAFFNIITSEKFTSLCKLLFEEFKGTNVDGFIDLSKIHSRMKEGAYESSPTLFAADIQQVWRKLQVIGSEMISLAMSLADLSRTSVIEQVGDSLHDTFDEGKYECFTRESDFNVKLEQTEAFGYKVCTCRHCEQKADERDCLVCDSCEDMYHVSCIEPAVKEIPPTSWYCVSCTANGIGSPHANCVVCERLNAPRNQTNEVVDEFSSRNETSIEFEPNSNCCTDDAPQSSEGVCKICGSDVDNGAKLRKCDHPFCPNKYYHERCLTVKQLHSYGPHWYCPSCLCRVCLTDRDDNKIVLCDGCDHAYHVYCLNPPLPSVPKGDWFCRKCHAGIQEIRRARMAFGNKMKEKVRVYGNPGKKIVERGEDESDKGRGGMDMLLNAAKTLNFEDDSAAIQTQLK